jgi:hypothetical protein
LKVNGKVTAGQVNITIQRGEETPMKFVFVQEEFELIQDLKKGDKITFEYEAGIRATVKLVATIMKQKHCIH